MEYFYSHGGKTSEEIMAFIPDIKKALESQLLAYTTIYPIAVAWESVDFTPEEGEPYLDPTFLPTRPVQLELQGSLTRDRVSGIFQINVVQKKGLGTSNIDTQFQQLSLYFNRGTAINYTTDRYEDILVEINRYYMGELNEDSPPWAFKPIYIEWRSDILTGFYSRILDLSISENVSISDNNTSL